MDVCEDELPYHSRFISAAGPECGQGLSLPDPCLSQHDGNILLQLLDFKAHLLEVVEELHIRRDAEERFEEQISKFVLEKQELEWEKESLQRQIESDKNMFAETCSKANKQFQTKIRAVEEEKSRYQASAEQKDKDIHNLKEELKSLQLTKYNLEKKSSELEQKLALQSRSKDTCLNQLSDVEKRFIALTRQCSMVKQAHGKLEQNVDETMKLNRKLTSTNEKQEVTIVSLNKEVEELRNKLVKTKMSSVNPDKKTENSSIKEQRFNQLQQKLNMECELNKKFKDENNSLQAEKREALTSLQLAHQLLSKQTQTLSRLELDLEAQRKQYQSLEQDHKEMQVKEKTMEENIKQLMEEYTVSKSSWGKEKAAFLNQIKQGEQELTTIKEAYKELHQNHTELSSKAEEQTQEIKGLRIKVKDLELRLIPSNSTEGSRENMSFTEGQVVCNEEDMSEIVVTSKINSPNHLCNSDNRPTATVAREISVEQTKSCTINNASADAMSNALESCEGQINSLAILSKELHFANKSVNINIEKLFQEDDSAVNTASTVTEEDGHVQENYKENKEEKTEDSPTEEQAQKTNGVSELSVTVEDDKDAALSFITMNVEKEHAKDEKCASEETERQENQLHVTEDARNNTQVNDSKSPSQSTMNEIVEKALHSQEKTRQDVLPSDKTESQVCASINDGQNTSPLVESPPCSVCHDLEENTETASKECTTADLSKTLNKSSLCQSQSDAAQLDSVSVQETFKTQTQMVSPPDTLGHTKDTVDRSAKECSPVTEIVKDVTLVSQKEISEEKNNLTRSVTEASQMSNNLTNDCEKKSAKEPMDISDKSNLKCKQSDGDKTSTDYVDSWNEFGTSQNLSKTSTKSQMSGANLIAKEAKIIDEFVVPIKTTYKPLFEWGSAQKRAQSDMSAHSILFTNSQMSQSNTSNYIGNSSNTFSNFHRSKVSANQSEDISRQSGRLSEKPTGTQEQQHKRSVQEHVQSMHQCTKNGADDAWVPLLSHSLSLIPLCARSLHHLSPVHGTSTTAALWFTSVSLCCPFVTITTNCPSESNGNQDSRVSVSDASSLVSTSSAPVLRPQNRSLFQDATGGTEFREWGPICSQDTEEEQSSFREQISKIEQFLNMDRLRLPKRRKIEN
ncbi:hypothetical protein WMY93_023943 [Mugilogobius chulae]|uniref:Coiled-coil domain-containing protein 73 n=1 Tax=Mugilogobius chulae TaxID=88201 RepID=A0AAW0NA36_9GOBI